MKKKILLQVLAIGLAGPMAQMALAQPSVTHLVDPLTGTEGGNVLPGACLPFSLVRLSPDCEPPTGTHGYNGSKNVLGFSHTHLSGTGGEGRYGNIQVIPVSGDGGWSQLSFTRQNETAAPGYYGATLARRQGDVHVELTVTPRAALHRYTFYNWRKEKEFPAWLLLNVSHVIKRSNKPDGSRCTGSNMQVSSPTTMQGSASFAGGWGGQNPYTVYFWLETDKPALQSGTWQDSTLSAGKASYEGTARGGGYFKYNMPQQGQLLVKVGISFKSIEQARANAGQVPGWDFDRTRRRADSTWNAWLGRVQLRGGTPEQQKLFYTSLYHTLIMPTDMTGEDPAVAGNTPSFWEHYCLWDVFRATMPLHTLLYPQAQRRILQSLVGVYQRTGWLPDAWVAGGLAQVQGGTNADVVLADAMVKKLGGFDEAKALEGMLKNANVPSDKPFVYGRDIVPYKKYGYLPAHIKCGTSRSQEYAYNDFCIGNALTAKGRATEAKPLFAQSQRVFGLHDSTTGFFWAKDTLGKWMPDFSPTFSRNPVWEGPYFYEGTPWLYSTYAPHAMSTLIRRHGGKEKFKGFLDAMFDGHHFDLENEPGFLSPYLYNYTGHQYRTAERVREVLRSEFRLGRKGWPGQDDSGALSSWYVWSSLGLFPVAGQDVYLVGSPLFEQASITLEGGKTLTIKATGSSPANRYVQGLKLNGKPVNSSYLTHGQLTGGGVLEFSMGSSPGTWYQNAAVPPSLGN